MKWINYFIIVIIVQIAIFSADKLSASDIKLFDKSTTEYFVPIADFPNDSALTDYIRSPKIINQFGIDINSGDLKFVSHWDCDLIFGENNSNNLVELTADENFISWNPSGFRLAVGEQIFSWGKADGINPTAVINRFDYRDPADVKKIPNPSVSFSIYPFSWLSIDAVYLPFKQTSLFPYNISDKFSVICKNISYEDDMDLKKPVAALRVNFFTGPVDLSFMYAYDIDQFYSPAIELGQYNSISSINFERKRIHRFGLDFKTTIGPVGLWGEACYSIGDNFTGPSISNRSPQLDWTTGFDFSYGPDDAWYVDIQYTGTYVLNYYSTFYTDYPDGKPDSSKASNKGYMKEYYYRAFTQALGSQFEGITHGFVIHSRWPLLNDTVTPSLSLSYLLPVDYDGKEKTKYGRGIIMPDIKWQVSDDLSLSAGASVFLAFMKGNDGSLQIDRNDPVGMFYDDSTAYVRLSYAWNYSPQSPKE